MAAHIFDPKDLTERMAVAGTTIEPPLRPNNREKPISWRHGSYNRR
jgi:hypothetical protein